MLKDIYSPLEIDEQWDQRAPMIEGDSVANMRYDAPDAGGATAVMDAPAAVSETPAPSTDTEPVSEVAPTTEASQTPAVEGDATPEETQVATTESAPVENNTDANPEDTTSTEDHAAALLEGMNSVDADEDKSKLDNETKPEGMDSAVIMPTQSFEPVHPREQETENSDHGIVTLGDHDSVHPASELIPLLEMPAIEKAMAASEVVESEVLKEAEEEIKSVIAKLEAELKDLQASISEKEKTIGQAESEKSELESQNSAVEAKISALKQV